MSNDKWRYWYYTDETARIDGDKTYHATSVQNRIDDHKISSAQTLLYHPLVASLQGG
jgi:hypothetical protein